MRPTRYATTVRMDSHVNQPSSDRRWIYYWAEVGKIRVPQLVVSNGKRTSRRHICDMSR